MKPQRSTTANAAHLGAGNVPARHPFSPRYDWEALPPRQEAPTSEFYRGLVIGAVIQAVLLAAGLGLFAWLWW